ncbi:hypothetical protein [Petropleomorpha daqingensis]|uniref:Antibiotic biosynthesis monooxygenase n=1 Tax=Petropleomorpha daqingensis TaxID=2026353 RepID=A0A853CKQ1_9ACTN|nr:hypothetical protein [Petropleomorpha daqingensis]NYJ07112.1 hypothetical protein [Petropleomorpha daqingensis]
MTYGFVMDVPAPIEAYEAMHAEIGRRTTGPVEGLLLHLGRATAGGFQIIELWESKEQYDRYDAELVAPVMAEMSGGQTPPDPPTVEEFEPRGLIIPSAALVS